VVGREIAHHKLRLVYGGGRTGLMGLVADSVLTHGGEVVGIMPKGLVEREIQHTGLTELHIVDTMHERKAMMAALADAFIALPGGFGTYDELMEIITWAQLGMHSKPILIVNVAGFYDPFFQLVEHSVREGFVRQIDSQLLRYTDDPSQAIHILQRGPDPDFRPKWMDLSQA